MSNLAQFAVILFLSAAQFLSDRINIERSKYRQHITSFAAAIAITYLLFSFLPKAYQNSTGLVLFIPMIAGFAFIHLVEKFFYSKYSGRFSIKRVRSYHDELHAFILFVYHFVIGAVLIGIMEKNILAGLLFLPPLVLFTTIGNWSLHHAYLNQVPHWRMLLASSTIFGALFAKSTLLGGMLVEAIMINFVAGFLLFSVVRESLPNPKEGKPMLFILGILAYGGLMFLINQIA